MIHPVTVGLRLRSSNSITTVSLNSADKRVALAFVAPTTTTVAKVTAFMSGETGTVGTSDLQCQIFSDAGLQPNSQLTNGVTTTQANTPNANTWLEFTFGTPPSVTAGVRYWIVLANVHATPASNYPSIAFLNASGYDDLPTTTMGNASGKVESSDGGSTWVTPVYYTGGYRVECSDGEQIGIAASSIALEGTNEVYAAREYGVKFTVPASYPTLKVKGIGVCCLKTGTPSAAPRVRLYNNETLLDTSVDIDMDRFDGNFGFRVAYFATPVSLTAGMTVRAVLGTTGSDAATDTYQLYQYNVQDAAGTRAALPMGGWAGTYLNSTWSDIVTAAPAIVLLLDPASPFTLSASGGGLLLVGG